MDRDEQHRVSEVRRRAWVSVALWGAAGAWIWLMSVALSVTLAQDVAATPQSNREMWVGVSEWLPAIPLAGAILIGMIAMVRRRNPMAVALVFAKGLFWFSVAIAVLAIPKAP